MFLCESRHCACTENVPGSNPAAGKVVMFLGP